MLCNFFFFLNVNEFIFLYLGAVDTRRIPQNHN